MWEIDLRFAPGLPPGWRHCPGRPVGTTHTVDYGPFIESQLASRNEVQGLMWHKFGQIASQILGEGNLRSPARQT